jgi:hypothetical protein
VAESASAITDEYMLELVVGSFLDEGITVWVACYDVGAIFWEGLVCRIVGSIVQFVRVFFRSPCLAVVDFDAEFVVDIFDDINRTISGLFFEFFGDMFCNETGASLGMANVVETKVGMLVVVCLDTTKGGSLDR